MLLFTGNASIRCHLSRLLVSPYPGSVVPEAGKYKRGTKLGTYARPNTILYLSWSYFKTYYRRYYKPIVHGQARIFGSTYQSFPQKMAFLNPLLRSRQASNYGA